MNGFADETFDIRRRGRRGRSRLHAAASPRSPTKWSSRRRACPESRSATTESMEVFTAKDIQALGSTSLVDVLRMVPGLNVESTGREGALSSLFARGGESDYNLVLIDGVRVNPSGGAYDFSRVSASEIDRLEVVRGGQSSLYGSDAIGSVVQVFTRRAAPGDAPQLIGSLEGGSFDTWRGDASVLGGARRRVDYQLGAVYRGTEGAFQDILPDHDTLQGDVDRRRHRRPFSAIARRCAPASATRTPRARRSARSTTDRATPAPPPTRTICRGTSTSRIASRTASTRRRRSTTSSRTGCRPTRSAIRPTTSTRSFRARRAPCSRTARGWCNCSINRRSRRIGPGPWRSAPASFWRRRRSA